MLTLYGIFTYMIEIEVKERVTGATRFTKEQREELEKRGYLIYTLTGATISSLKKEGAAFWSKWHEGRPIENVSSRLSEVAINPNDPFLAQSGGKSVFEQMKQVNAFGKIISSEINGVRAVTGSAADYAELGFLHKKQTGGSLFRRYGGNSYTHSTDLVDGRPLFVGEFYDESLVVSYRLQNRRESDIKAIPLIIPT